jgi:hypothetical protein
MSSVSDDTYADVTLGFYPFVSKSMNEDSYVITEPIICVYCNNNESRAIRDAPSFLRKIRDAAVMPDSVAVRNFKIIDYYGDRSLKSCKFSLSGIAREVNQSLQLLYLLSECSGESMVVFYEN